MDVPSDGSLDRAPPGGRVEANGLRSPVREDDNGEVAVRRAVAVKREADALVGDRHRRVGAGGDAADLRDIRLAGERDRVVAGAGLEVADAVDRVSVTGR